MEIQAGLAMPGMVQALQNQGAASQNANQAVNNQNETPRVQVPQGILALQGENDVPAVNSPGQGHYVDKIV